VKGRGTTELREEQLLFWPEGPKDNAPREKQLRKRRHKSPILKTRYENLCYLISSKFEGSSSLLASQIGAAQEQVEDVLSAEVTRSPVSAKLARRIEKSCGLDALWLDQKHADPTRLASKIALLDVRARLALEAVVSALIDA
jgi:hypothetical protein